MSGGLDSTVMLYDLHRQGVKVHCALFDYHQRHVQELQWAMKHCLRLGVKYTTLSVPKLLGSQLTDDKGSVIVPNRNAIFLSLAVNVAVAAGAETVTFAANSNDEALFPDCRMAFVQAFNTMLRVAEIPVEVSAPYIDKSKAWIARRGADIGVKFDETWSCYRGGIRPCGECYACKQRALALAVITPNEMAWYKPPQPTQ